MKEHRPPRSGLWSCLIFSTVFAAVGAHAVYVMLANPEGEPFPHPIGGAIFIGSLYFGMALFGVIAGFQLQTERVFIGSDAIELRRWGRSRVLGKNEITKAEWRSQTRGKLVLSAPNFRFAVSFDNYGPDRSDLIHGLRSLIPESVQENWPAFEFSVFPDEAEKERRRQRSEQPVSMLVVFPIMAAVTWMLAWTIWLFIAEHYERPNLAWLGAGVIVLGSALWVFVDWRRAKNRSLRG